MTDEYVLHMPILTKIAAGLTCGIRCYICYTIYHWLPLPSQSEGSRV